MRDERKTAREAEIREVAYRLLMERGYARVSMLMIARHANASNETLYRWYGDKKGLFRTLVDANADVVRAHLDKVAGKRGDALENLRSLAPVLLTMLLGDRAVLLNRAAAGDESGELGSAIAQGGREAVFPMLESLIERAMKEGAIEAPNAAQAADWYISLLVGDLQIRRVTGALPQPDAAFIARRSTSAMTAFLQLCAAQNQSHE